MIKKSLKYKRSKSHTWAPLSTGRGVLPTEIRVGEFFYRSSGRGILASGGHVGSSSHKSSGRKFFLHEFRYRENLFHMSLGRELLPKGFRVGELFPQELR
jgi:hypothetical protein